MEVALWSMAVFLLRLWPGTWSSGRPTPGHGGRGAGPGWAGPGFSSPLCAFLWGSNPPRPSFSLQKGFLRLPWAPASGQGWPWLLMNPLRPSPRGQCETGLDLSCVCDLSPGRGAWGCVLQ